MSSSELQSLFATKMMITSLMHECFYPICKSRSSPVRTDATKRSKRVMVIQRLFWPNYKLVKYNFNK